MTGTMERGSFPDGTALFLMPGSCSIGTGRMEVYMREHFLDRLYGEYQEYRASLLGCTNTEIFSRCYEIDAIVNFYEILQEKAERMSDGELAVLLRKRDILADIYSSWLEKSDSAYTEMAAHVEEEMKNIITGTVITEISGNRKEG